MNRHLSSQQIEEWVIGQRTGEAEAHLRMCQACAAEVERVAGQLELFGSAVRSWGEELGGVRTFLPVQHRAGIWRWRVALAGTALLVTIAVPVFRREETKRQAAVTAVQDEILLRQVESGISRSVPAPMEPLAKLLSSDMSR